MSTVMEDCRDSVPHFHRVRWRFLIRRRPYCPDHPETLMESNRTEANGLTRYYCPVPGCDRTWKGRPQIEG